MSTSFNGILILSFAFLTLRYALVRNIDIHQRWAMRLVLVSNAQWFLRVGVIGYLAINSAFGRAPNFSDPFFLIWTFGSYLFPLFCLQVYFHARDHGGAATRWVVALCLAVLTLLMGVGSAAYAIFSQTIISGAPLGF